VTFRGPGERVFDPLLHDIVSPVIVRGGVRHNVVPSEVELVLDGRVLPGFGADDLAREVRDLLDTDAQVRVDSFDPCPDHLDLGLFGRWRRRCGSRTLRPSRCRT